MHGLSMVFAAIGFAIAVSPSIALGANDEKMRSVDALFERWGRGDSRGRSLGIIRDGRLAYERGQGMVNLEDGVPIAHETD